MPLGIVLIVALDGTAKKSNRSGKTKGQTLNKDWQELSVLKLTYEFEKASSSTYSENDDSYLFEDEEDEDFDEEDDWDDEDEDDDSWDDSEEGMIRCVKKRGLFPLQKKWRNWQSEQDDVLIFPFDF